MTQAGRVCTCTGRPHPPPVFQPLPGPSPEAGSLESTMWWVRWALEGRLWGLGINRALSRWGFNRGSWSWLSLGWRGCLATSSPRCVFHLNCFASLGRLCERTPKTQRELGSGI